MHKILHHIVIVIAFAVSGCASAASFDCAKTRTKIEKMICLDAELSELDVNLAKIYTLNVSKISTQKDQQAYRNKQLSWLKSVRNKCKDVQCLSRAYSERIAVLENVHKKASENDVRKITAVGTISIGSTYSSIGNKANFLTKSEVGTTIFDKCELQDICQVTGTVDKNGCFATVSDVTLLRSSKQ